MPLTPIGKTAEESIDEKQVKQLEAINKSLGNLKGSVDALKKISRNKYEFKQGDVEDKHARK